MNDHPHPEGPVPDADELDELASALVDGEASEAERRRAGDPEVAARVRSFAAVARLVARPVEPVGEGDRDRAVAAALAAFGTEPPLAAGAGDVLALRRRRIPAWVGAAAAVAVLAVGAGLLLGGRDGAPDDVAQGGADTARPEAADDAGASTGAGAGSAGAPVPATGDGEATILALPDLGSFDDGADLAAAADAATAASSDGGSSEQNTASRVLPACTTGGPPGSEPVLVAAARLAGQPVTVVVFVEPDGRRSVVAFDDATCDLVFGADLG